MERIGGLSRRRPPHNKAERRKEVKIRKSLHEWREADRFGRFPSKVLLSCRPRLYNDNQDFNRNSREIVFLSDVTLNFNEFV